MSGFFSKVANGFAFGLGASVGHSLFGLIKFLIGIIFFGFLVLAVFKAAGVFMVEVDSVSGFFSWMMGVSVLVLNWIVSLLGRAFF